MQIGAYAEPWYFSVVFNRPIQCDDIALTKETIFSLATSACDEIARHYPGISNSKVELLTFSKRLLLMYQ